jgi:hypothetical protein
MDNFAPGNIVVFNTRRSDMMNFNGRKCLIVSASDDGTFVVNFLDPSAIVFDDELMVDEEQHGG